MSLTYNPTNWINKKTPLNSNNMNNIESGIVQAINSINSIISQLSEIENLINSEFITTENIKDNAVTYNKTNFVIKDGDYLKIPELTINGEQVSVTYEEEQTDLQTYLNELVIRLTDAINSLRTEIYNQMDEKLYAIWTTLEQANTEIQQAFANVDSRFTSTENDYNGKFNQVQDALVGLNTAVTALQEAVSGALKRQIVQELPITGEPNIIYMVPAEPEIKKVSEEELYKTGTDLYTWEYKANKKYYSYNRFELLNTSIPDSPVYITSGGAPSGEDFSDLLKVWFKDVYTGDEVVIPNDFTFTNLATYGTDLELYTLVEGNIYNEYLWIDNKWEKIGDTKTDLTDYYTKEETDEEIIKQCYEVTTATAGYESNTYNVTCKPNNQQISMELATDHLIVGSSESSTASAGWISQELILPAYVKLPDNKIYPVTEIGSYALVNNGISFGDFTSAKIFIPKTINTFGSDCLTQYASDYHIDIVVDDTTPSGYDSTKCSVYNIGNPFIITNYYTKAEVDEKINDKFNEGLVIARHNNITAYNDQNSNLVVIPWTALYVPINPVTLVNKNAYLRLTLTLADTENQDFVGDMTFRLRTEDNSEYSYAITAIADIKSPGSYVIDIPLENFVLNGNNILSQISNITAFTYYTYGTPGSDIPANRYSVTFSDIRFTKSSS